MKKILLAILLLIILLVAIILVRTFTFTSSDEKVDLISPYPIPEMAIERLEEAISIRTISFEDEADFDSTQFQKFNEFLAKNYPLLHEQSEHKVFSNFSHLYTIEGKSSNQEPILLMAHLDVVPIASPALWSVHPFTEGVKNDTIYGRGCIDDKSSLVSLLEAIEQLLSEGFEPQRTVYISLGHDEEIGGKRGAVEIASYLKEKDVHFAFVLDEGGALTRGMIPGIDKHTGLIGIAEKGSVSLELEVLMSGGHSSRPEKETAIDVLAEAVSTLKKNPFPKKITPVLDRFLDEAGPHMNFTSKMAMANRWLFKPVLLNQYEKTSVGNASIRTTTAPTIFNAGVKENVIPTIASAVVNFRILPGETVESTIKQVEDILDDDRVSVNAKEGGTNPSAISSIDGEEYKVLTHTIKSIYPDVLTIPNLVIGGTDSRHFTDLSTNIYRFLPVTISPQNIECFHGIDERIGIDEYENAIRFYRQIFLNFNK